MPGAEDASLDLSSASAAAEHANSSPPSPLLQAFGFMAENDSVASSVAVAAEHDGSAAAETGIGTWHPKVSTSDIKDTRKEREQTGCRVPEEAHELAREQRPASPAAEQHQAAGAFAGTAELPTPVAEQRPLETQSRAFKHRHRKAPEPAPAETHVNEKNESETDRKTEFEKMLREDALVAQALQDIEDAEYQERLAAVRARRKTRRVRNKTRAAKST